MGLEKEGSEVLVISKTAALYVGLRELGKMFFGEGQLCLCLSNASSMQKVKTGGML